MIRVRFGCGQGEFFCHLFSQLPMQSSSRLACCSGSRTLWHARSRIVVPHALAHFSTLFSRAHQASYSLAHCTTRSSAFAPHSLARVVLHCLCLCHSMRLVATPQLTRQPCLVSALSTCTPICCQDSVEGPKPSHDSWPL